MGQWLQVGSATGDAMLPYAPARVAVGRTAWLLAAWLAAGGCAGPESPEDQVRAAIAAGEAAAEERDLGGLMDLVSTGFRDEHGRDAGELKQYLRGYLVAHPSVHLLTRVEEIEFPYRDYARARLTVGGVTGGASGAAALDLSADVHDVVLEFRLEDGAWRVVRAEWRSAGRD